MGDRFAVRRRPLVRWLLLPALLVSLAGCGLVPTGGPVMKGRPVQPADPMSDPYVRVIPTGPRPGWTPEQIVRGFLSDSASFRDGHSVAREYFAPAVRSRWQPGRKTTLYAQGAGYSLAVERSSKTDAVVKLAANKVATIDARGQYTAAAPGSRVTVRFRLRAVGGEWRIVGFPQGLLLTERDVRRAYRTLNLYFFEPGHETLVPNPVYVSAARKERLPTRLVRALVRGATSWYAPAVRSAFPEGTYLLEDVSVSSGTAVVRLGGAAGGADSQALARMSAQLVWTLEQLPAIEQVRLRVDGETVRVPDAGQSVSTEDWASLDPAGTSGAVHGYVVRGQRLMVTSQDGLQPAPGPAGSKEVPVHEPAISLDAKHAAWLSESADTVFIGELREGGRYREALRGERFTSLSWDRYGNLWAVEDAGNGSTVWVFPEGGQPYDVEAPELRNRDVHTLRVARDGTRMAVVADSSGKSQVMLGRIERDDEQLRVDGLTMLPTDFAKVADVAWRDGDRLAVLGKDLQGAFAPYLVDVDGSTVSSIGSVGKMRAIAAAPDAPMLVELDGGEVFQSPDDRGWGPLGQGIDPVYPG